MRSFFGASVPAIAVLAALAVVSACADDVPTPTFGAPGSIHNRVPPPGASGGSTGGTTGATTGAAACDTEAQFKADDDAACTVKFSTNIFPKMQAGGPWRCSEGACHNNVIGKVPVIPVTDAAATWNVLRTIKTTALTDPYVNPCSKDPAASSFLGNLSGTKGAKMPQVIAGVTAATAAEIADVEKWIRCGSPNN